MSREHVGALAYGSLRLGLSEESLGKMTRFPLEINAVDGFVPACGRVSFEGVAETSGIRYQPVHPLKRGRLAGWFDVVADAPLATHAEAALTLIFTSERSGRQRTLRFPVVLRVATARQKAAEERKHTPPTPKPKKGHAQKKGTERPSVAIIWDDLDPAIAAELRPLSGDVLAAHGYKEFRGFTSVPTVILNNVHVEWAKFRDRYLAVKSERTIKFHQEQYATQLGLYVHDLVTSEEKLAEAQTTNGATAAELNGSRAMSPEQRQRAITHTARTIVVSLASYSKLLETLAPEERIMAAVEGDGA